MRARLALGVLALLTAAVSLAAEEGRPSLHVPLIDVEPMLEDFVQMSLPSHLEGKMARVGEFIQRTPNDGAPPSHPTQVYVAYDRKHLYAMFIAFDAEPHRIRANLGPREQLFDDDSVNIMIDTFNDQRRAYFFISTPRGVQADGQYTEGNGFDGSFEAVWHSEGRLTDRGYVVKIKIPFISLRFPDTPEQTWRVIFNRMIPRLSEDSFWPRYTLAIDGRLNQTALMTGIRDISASRNVQLVPFVFARDFRTEESEAGGPLSVDDDNEEAVGLDAKFVLNDALVLDVTANPDFSQVEADQPQVTVNQRFEVFFPERRPFFLENTDVFRSPTNLVFTRRIADPSGGIKLTGKLGRYALGALFIDDEEPGKSPDAGDLRGERAKIGILRLARDVSGQSKLGFLFTSRDLAGGFNRVGAVDGRITFGDVWVLQFQAAAAATNTTDGEEFDGVSYNTWLNRNGKHFSTHTHYLYTSPGFRTDLGFLGGEQRADSQNIHHQMSYRFRPAESRLTEWGPSIRFERIFDTSGNPLDWSISSDIVWNWTGNTRVEIDFNRSDIRLRPDEVPVLPQPQDYSTYVWSVELSSNRLARLGYNLDLEYGSRINFVPPDLEAPRVADFRRGVAGLTLRPTPPLRLDLTYIWTELTSRESSIRAFTNTIARLRARWQFTRELSLRLITDYEKLDPVATETASNFTRDEQVTLDMLLRYQWNPWWALFVGYTSSDRDFQVFEPMPASFIDRRMDGQQFFVKFSYLFQL